MSTDSHELRTLLGAYTLSALDDQEARRVQAHLAGCAACRREHDELSPLPSLLGLLSVEDVEPGHAAGADPALLTRILAEVAARRRAERRRRRLLVAVAAVAVALSGSAVGVAVATLRQPPAAPVAAPPAARVQSAGPGGTGVRAAAVLHSKAWGTAVHVDVTGVAAGQDCRLVAVSGARRETAATWRATPSGRAAVDGATGIPTAELTSLEVTTGDGRPLVRLPVRRS